MALNLFERLLCAASEHLRVDVPCRRLSAELLKRLLRDERLLVLSSESEMACQAIVQLFHVRPTDLETQAVDRGHGHTL